MMQFQMFLQQLIPAMEFGTALMTPLAVLLAILYSCDGGNLRKTFRKAAYWGFWGSVFIMAAKQGTRNAVSREGFEGLMAFFAIISELILAGALLGSSEKFMKRLGIFKKGVIINVLALTMYYGMEIWLIPVTTVLNVNNPFSAEMLIRMLGFAAGLFIAVVGSWLIYHAAKSLNDKRLYTVFLIQVAALLIQQIIYLVQILMARGILPARYLIKVMAPVIDHQDWFIFIVFIVVFAVPAALFSQKCPARPAGCNPAQYRKIVADDIHKKRWGKASVGALIVMIILSSVGSAYANKKEELVPAVSVTAKDQMVSIDINKVNDGHLHRFAYRTKKGTQVRFIVVLKGGSAYGVGLDCCEICGPTGYIEREGQIVCKLCDVVMNKQTIGLPGGCNPIPVKYGVGNGQIRIEQKELDAAAKYFR